MKETVKQGTVIQKKLPELPVDGKDTMAVGDIYELKGHRGCALHGIEVPTGREETAVAAEGDEF